MVGGEFQDENFLEFGWDNSWFSVVADLLKKIKLLKNVHFMLYSLYWKLKDLQKEQALGLSWNWEIFIWRWVRNDA